MLMSNLIDQTAQVNKIADKQFIQKLKFIIHQQLKKYTIIFTVTNQNSKFHYYTFLDPQKHPTIELYWIIDFTPNSLNIQISYSAYRTLGIPIIINDLRTKIQINSVLRILNKNIPYFLTFTLNQKNQITLLFNRSVFNQSDKNTLIKGIKSVVNQCLQQSYQAFSCLIPFLSIPLQTYFQSSNHHNIYKNPLQTQQFNLIKVKNTFDRYRKNRQKTSDLIYQQKDINKIRKKIESSITMLGYELKSLNNLKYVTKQIRRDKLLENIQQYQEEKNFIHTLPTKVDKIAYQFQILNIEDKEKKWEINSNSEIYLGTYNFRIFKTLIEEEKITKSQNYKKSNMPQFQQKDVIQQRVAKLVKKKPNSKLSQKALKNQISFLKFMRNQICIYIANYFLPLQNTTQLYIQHYEESLLNVIQSQKLKSFSERLEIMINLIKGLKFISDTSICHRDIKPSNIMLNEYNHPKIIDFGSSISANNQKVIMVCNQKLCATQGYHYPYDKCDQKIKYLFTRKQYQTHPLFDIYSYGSIAQKIFNPQLHQNYHNFTIKDTLQFMILKCKQQNPDNRLSYDQILCLLIILKKSLTSNKKCQDIL